ncbi:MAG: type II toxin-antitoxin system VapC family toxin [Spirochaetia bacterium]|jgi:predicted nucleic acid-binding protein|nr:type II toxin-antitoxin system VapC family toxin [Spirochaetia bacterium]
MKYLLDTCVISELVKPSPNANVIEWINNTPDERLYLSVITIGEVRKGLTKLPDSKRKDLLANWLNSLLEDYDNRIYPINLTVAENWGIIQGKAEKKGTPMASIDSLIAATAYTYNLVLVTRNIRDFEASRLPIRNPWVE